MNAESLESRIGSRWLLYVGIAAVVIAVAYFEKLAFDHGWISELVRVVQGGVIGVLLVWVGLWFVRAGFPFYGEIVCGGGIAVLYVSTYAAFNFYHLIDRLTALDLLYVIAATTAWLANRYRSQGLAFAAVTGGFATPLLLPSPTAAPLSFFGYQTILIAVTGALAARRGWPSLNAISVCFTIVTLSDWGGRFYAPSMYLTVEAFLTLYCAMYLAIRQPLAVRRSAPILYYIASISILAPHPTALLVYLLALTIAAAAIASRVGEPVRLVMWLIVAVPLLVWCAIYGTPERFVAGATTVTAIYLINLISQSDVALLHLNGLAAYFAAHILVDSVNPDATAALAAGFALWHGTVALLVAKRSRDRAIQYAALGFKLLAIAIFLRFHGEAAIAGWAAEGAVVIWLGLREGREWLRLGGVALFLLSVVRLLALQFPPTPPPYIVLNARVACAAFVIGLTYALAWVQAGRQNGIDRASDVAVAVVVATVLILTTMSSEIGFYWNSAGGTPFGREMTLSLAWAISATVIVVIGLWRRYAPIRRLAIVVFGLTTLKVFTVDLALLDSLYRVASVLGLGVTLLVTSYLYQRFRLLSSDEAH